MNKKRSKILFAAALTSMILFLAFTVAVMTVDIGKGGEGNVKIGFSTLNLSFENFVGRNETVYVISDILGWFSLIFAFAAACLGAHYLFRYRSFKKVPGEIYLTGMLYISDIILYFVFDKLAVNLRPVLENGISEPSYPSSHTLLAMCVCASAIVLTGKYVKKASVRKFAYAAETLIAAAAVITRLFSGYHWLTDIIGCIFLAAALILIYVWSIEKIKG